MSKVILPSGFLEVFEFSDADLVVFCDYQKDDFQRLKDSQFPKEKSLLIRVEPRPILPDNFDSEFVNSFKFLFDLGRTGTQSTACFPWPQKWRQLDTSLKRIDSAVIIAGNKLSLIRGELYSLRREALHQIQDIHLYGTEWDISLYRKLRILASEIRKILRMREKTSHRALKYWFRKAPNWKGAIENKHKYLARYRYSVVIENSQEFLTEKLFDAFFSGTIPIYVGPDISRFKIPEDLVIQVSPTLDAIRKGIEIAKELDYELWLSNLENWLAKQTTLEDWELERVYKRISVSIQELL